MDNEMSELSSLNKQVTNKTRKYGLIRQCFLTAVVSLATGGLGMPVGYSAILLPQLQSTNESFQIDEHMGSWIASTQFAASPIGTLLGGSLMEILGRKLTLQLSCIPLVCGWLLILLSQNFGVLLTGRVLTSISVGLIMPISQIYLAETAYPSLRGVFGSTVFSSYTFGILLVYMLGSATHWRTVAGISITLPALAMVMFFFLPESPPWLVKRNKIEAASKSCLWLQDGNIRQVEQDIQELIHRSKNEKKSNTYLATFAKRHYIKSFILVNVFFILSLLSGSYIFIFYAVDIISLIKGDGDINEYLAAVLTAAIRFVCTIIGSVLLAFLGRRTIGISSALGCGIPAILLAVILQFDIFKNSYSIGACLLIYVAANSFGLMILPGVLFGEMFPIAVRGFLGTVSYIIFCLTIFGMTKAFPFIKNLVTIQGCFLFFGVSALFMSLFVYLVLPETKNMTLNEIEDYFKQDNILWCRTKRIYME